MTPLRFLTCGSVDDGKSTLIGRMLHDAGLVPRDQIEDARDGEAIDYARLVDGLEAEREQAITIDVAYRYFATARRSFIVADVPGHEQYTRNMATGAADAALALLLVDARKGLLIQTRRHATIARLLGVGEIVLAVNKMDLVGHDETIHRTIAAEFGRFATSIGLDRVTAIPVSALLGENLVTRSPAMSWFDGPTLLAHLEAVDPPAARRATSLRMPVQYVARDGGKRVLLGSADCPEAASGDRVRILPSGCDATIASISTGSHALALTLTEDVDCARGDVITAADDPPAVADQFEAALIWFDEEPLLPGRSYWFQLATMSAAAVITDLKYQLNVDTGEHVAAKTLAANAIGIVNLSVDRDLAFAPYDWDRTLGGFILIDRATNATAAAGLIRFALRRAHNLRWQRIEVDRDARAALKAQTAKVVWFTGLSGAGKSTIANLVEKKLHAMGRHTFLLDGDNLRHGLSRDLGFTDADRVENIRRAGEVARLMADAGLIVLAAFISPFRAERRMVRELLAPGEFVEVFVDAPLAEVERRDAKGLYRKARAGLIANFTGIDSGYEPPEAPELRIDTAATSAEDAADLVIAALGR